MDIKSCQIDNAKFKKSSDRLKYNYKVAEFYHELSCSQDGLDAPFRSALFYRRSQSVKNCFKFLDIDYYRLQAVKDVKRTNLCRDLFCQNCQYDLSMTRQRKYMPIIKELSKRYSLYHMVLTIPNVPGEDLKKSIDKMYCKFPYLIQFFDGRKRSGFFDFSKIGYVGCIRSLEVTTRCVDPLYDEYEYHPHFHCVFFFRRDFRLEKHIKNCYSFDKYHDMKNPRMFSEFEILLQKMWYLFMNDIPFTKKNLDDVSVGYSVILDRVTPKKCHEVFKYTVKGIVKHDYFNYSMFRILYDSLHGRRIIQGYGVFRCFKFSENELDEDLDEKYEVALIELRHLEDPVFCVQTLKETLEDMELHKEIRYISKSKLRNYDDK